MLSATEGFQSAMLSGCEIANLPAPKNARDESKKPPAVKIEFIKSAEVRAIDKRIC